MKESKYVSESKAMKIYLAYVKWRREKYFLMHNFFSSYTWYLYWTTEYFYGNIFHVPTELV